MPPVLRRFSNALFKPAPQGAGFASWLAEALQWIAAFSVAEPVLLGTLGAFTEPLSHLFGPAWLQLLVQLPGAICLAVAAHYLQLGTAYVGLGRTVRWFTAFGFAFFGGWLLALGVDILLYAL